MAVIYNEIFLICCFPLQKMLDVQVLDLRQSSGSHIQEMTQKSTSNK